MSTLPNRIYSLLLAISAFLWVSGLKAQGPVTSTSVLPFVYYLPETSWAFGLGAVYTFDRDTTDRIPASQAQAGLAYTLNEQWLFYLSWRIFTREAKSLTYGELGYYRYVYPYYGIGAESALYQEEYYRVNFPRIRLNYLWAVSERAFIGPRFWYDDFQLVEFADDGQLKDSAVLGVEGGRISALGLVANWDTRDNQLYPSAGFFGEIALLPYTSLSGSTYEYLKLGFDWTQYWPVQSNQVLAFNAFWEANVGQTPFYSLAFLGGSRRLRGFIDGRFRAAQANGLQLEYRYKPFKRWGFTAFVGSGNVFENLDDWALQTNKLAGGMGVRFQLSKASKIHMRLDAARSLQEPWNFYLTFGEAF